MFDEPDEVAHGLRINPPALNEGYEPEPTEDGTEFLTLNARRVRMIVQPPSNWGETNLAMVLLYREGEEGHGHPAHIIMRRFIGGYEPNNLECTKFRKDPLKKDVCVEGSNDLNEDNIPDPLGEGDDARAHRGFLRGDFLVVGYTYTPKWGRGFPKRYDFFVRRSFDGGEKWTNSNGNKKDPRNLSNIKEEGNRGWSVMEPRLYSTPGTIGKPPQTQNDVQNNMVYFAAYSTTLRCPVRPFRRDQLVSVRWFLLSNRLLNKIYARVQATTSYAATFPMIADRLASRRPCKFLYYRYDFPSHDRLFHPISRIYPTEQQLLMPSASLVVAATAL